jgi:hypothetical protein
MEKKGCWSIAGRIAALFCVLALLFSAVPLAFAEDNGDANVYEATPSINVTQTMRASTRLPGAEVIFDFQIKNGDAVTAPGVELIGTADPSIVFDRVWQSTGRLKEDITATTFDAGLSNLGPGKEATVTVFAHIKPNAVPGTGVISIATATWVAGGRTFGRHDSNLVSFYIAQPAAPAAPAPAPQPTPFDRISAFTSTPDNWYFQETGHSLSYGFLGYWLNHNGPAILGFPLSEELTENGRVVQYFERGKLEYWPENPQPYTVLISDLGRQLYQPTPPVPAGPNVPGHTYFAQTGHWLNSPFLEYWQANGGLVVFGYPIREPEEVNGMLVQVFERARFEYHPENAGTPYAVQLGLLGREQLMTRGLVQ